LAVASLKRRQRRRDTHIFKTDHLLAGVYSRNPIDEPFLFPRQRSGERSLAKPESSDDEEATARGRISKTLKKFLLAVGIKSPGSGL